MRDDRDLSPDRPKPGQPGSPGLSSDADRRADEEHYHDLQRARQTRVAKVLVALFLIGVLVAFIVANSQSVVVHFVFVTRRPALIWVMFACAVMGGIIGYLIGRPGKQVRLHRRKDEPKKD
jgi:uncharacterized integral membrane protein